MYDFIIAGGGVSGVFFAWRMNTFFPNKKILLIEKEERLGGRLLSYNLGNGMYAELFAMRSFPDIDKELTKTLQMIGKKSFPVPYNEPQNVAELKGKRFLVSVGDATGQQKAELEKLYRTGTTKSVNGSVSDAEVGIAPEILGDWTRMFSSGKLNGEIYGESLIKEGVSCGTIEAYRDLSGYNFAFDAPIGTSTGIRENSSLSGTSQQHFIEGGYDSVVFELAKRLTDTKVVLGATLTEFSKNLECKILGIGKVKTKNLILALPPNALCLLGIDYFPYVENWSAFKAFFIVPRETWRLLSLNGQRKGRNVSSGVARQIWFYSEEPYVLMLYCDNASGLFWRNKIPKEKNGKFESCELYPELTENFRACCSKMFGVSEEKIDLETVLFYYHNHGAFFWKAGGYRDLTRIRKNVSVVGSAISMSPGWVNGALQSSEVVLRRYGIPSVLEG
ncbi:flavin-containing amine oxidoreductase [Tokyovirus A1]|uniref:flavin-containing amine oxidoreductase n=1 Tax=Tokyovirus A1 TaxID=1826170 RepID=UPI0007A98FED|nr:flavin-containing amine oxidoreductase [Tokyovirus A1]BAU80012.1 flavin-containing amine oxidoreductase [Tokyovirus A1]